MQEEKWEREKTRKLIREGLRGKHAPRVMAELRRLGAGAVPTLLEAMWDTHINDRNYQLVVMTILGDIGDAHHGDQPD